MYIYNFALKLMPHLIPASVQENSPVMQYHTAPTGMYVDSPRGTVGWVQTCTPRIL